MEKTWYTILDFMRFRGEGTVLKLFGKKTEEKDQRRDLPVICAPAETGLTAAQAAQRAEAGWDNRAIEPPTRTKGQIIRSNTLTYFNAIFVILAVCLVAVRSSILNLNFLVVVIVNAVIGIVQEF